MSASGGPSIWVPVNLYLPLGAFRQWDSYSSSLSEMLCGPLVIIFLAQCANTVLIPVLPFLVKDVGGNAVSYGALQSTLWTSQTVLAPVLGALSDALGRKPVIVLSLIVSGVGGALLATSYSFASMCTARVISGLGFQIGLFRAYYADVAPKNERAGKFGLIGVIQSSATFGGPFVGGMISQLAGRRTATWIAAGFSFLAAFVALVWNPHVAEKEAERRASAAHAEGGLGRRSITGVGEVVHIELDKLPRKDDPHLSLPLIASTKMRAHGWRERAHRGPPLLAPLRSAVKSFGGYTYQGLNYLGKKLVGNDWFLGKYYSEGSWYPCKFAITAIARCFRTLWALAVWLGAYHIYPLLSLNFCFRFAFAIYKSTFAFFCANACGYGAKEVGMLLSATGAYGMFAQGVLVKVVVNRLHEERALNLAMATTAVGFALLSYASGYTLVIPALVLICTGYGIAVPCLTTMFSHIPVEQGAMQGIAGCIDRFGSAFGPIVGGIFLKKLGEAWLMRGTGIALAVVTAFATFICAGDCALCGQDSEYEVVSTQETSDGEQQDNEQHDAQPLRACQPPTPR